MFLKTLTTNTVSSRSTLVTSNTKVIDLIYHAALAHNSMKDTKFKIVSTQAVRAIELLLYNFNFAVINHHKVIPNVKFEVLCQYEHNTAIRNTASL